MATKHYEFTGETKVTLTGTLHRIRATRNIPCQGVSEGDVGGWIGENVTLSGDAWVHDNAQVYGNARVFGNAWVHDDVRVFGNAWLEDAQDIITVGPIGSESVTAIAYPNQDGTHTLTVGCWTGDIERLASEVAKRSENWDGAEAEKDRWRAEYAALETLVRARITAWNKEN